MRRRRRLEARYGATESRLEQAPAGSEGGSAAEAEIDTAAEAGGGEPAEPTAEAQAEATQSSADDQPTRGPRRRRTRPTGDRQA